MRAANGRRGGLGLIRRPYTEVISSAFSLGGSTIAPFWPSRRSSTTQIAFQRATTMPLRANCWDLECLKSRIKHPHCILLIQRPYTKVKTSAFSLGRSTIAPLLAFEKEFSDSNCIPEGHYNAFKSKLLGP